MSEWKPVVVLPNIGLQKAVEGELAALVPTHDARVESYPALNSFLSRFTDAFGREINPSILIVPEDVPETILGADALSGFRDAIALSVIPYNRARKIKSPQYFGVFWADYFAMYPWMISKDHDDRLVARTPALFSTDDPKDFRGQSSPELATMTVGAIDEPLLTALLKRWREYYTTGDPTWPDIALFRSLNMAFRAAEIPAGTEITFYDIGRSISLWVSAFEILAHPGDGGDVNLSKVYGLLDKVAWHIEASKAESHPAYNGKKARISKCNGCWLYGELYRARNDFLHGNPVDMNGLKIDDSGRNLYDFAAPLYRMALTAFLPLAWSEPVPSLDDVDEIARYSADHMHFIEPQQDIETGLLKAHSKPKE